MYQGRTSIGSGRKNEDSNARVAFVERSLLPTALLHPPAIFQGCHHVTGECNSTHAIKCFAGVVAHVDSSTISKAPYLWYFVCCGPRLRATYLVSVANCSMEGSETCEDP